MKAYSFLLSRRWILFAIFVVALSAVCVRLGFWQWHRLEHRLDRNVVIEKHLRADPVPLDQALPVGDRAGQSDEWTRVTATGRWDTARTVTVKFAVRDGAPGVDVVTPLVLSDGTALWVDRGWIQTQNTAERPTGLPDPGTGEVTVSGWLRPDNGAGPDATRPVQGQVRAVSSAALADRAGRSVRGGYVDLLDQQPAVAGDLSPEPAPELGQGPHFFYALQWWFFALLAIVGYGWFARTERKERDEARDEGKDGVRPPATPRPKRQRQSNHPSARAREAEQIEQDQPVRLG